MITLAQDLEELKTALNDAMRPVLFRQKIEVVGVSLSIGVETEGDYVYRIELKNGLNA